MAARRTKQIKTESSDLTQTGSLLSTQTNPMIFISHDNRDADLAESFSNLLQNVSMGILKSFRSSDRRGSQGIEYGVEWYPDIMGKLHQASDVVCLLTERSIERPWILYEAGVAKGKFETPVVGLALGIPLNKASTGPFAQFQNCQDDEDSLTGLVTQLVCRIPNADPTEAVIRTQVKAFKEQVTPILEKLGAKDEQNEENLENSTSVAKLFEEVKVMFQDLPTRIENRVDPYRKRKFRHMHPKMFHEFFFMAKEFGEPSLGLLVASSYFREQLPWLYELSLDIHRAVQSGSSKQIDKALKSFIAGFDLIRRIPVFDKFDDDSFYFLTKELRMLADEFVFSMEKTASKSKRKLPAIDAGAKSNET